MLDANEPDTDTNLEMTADDDNGKTENGKVQQGKVEKIKRHMSLKVSTMSYSENLIVLIL